MLLLNEPVAQNLGIPTRREVAGMVRWNLWKIRQAPYNEVEDGEPIVLVDSWPGGSRLTWLTRARDVVKCRYSSRKEAAEIIAKAFGLDVMDVLSNAYTASRPVSGHLLALGFAPVRKLGLARPSYLHLRRNGWASIEDATLTAMLSSKEDKPA